MLIDFRNSFINWQTHDNSFGKFNAESAVLWKNEWWLLGSKVIACNMYQNSELVKTPAYYYQPAFSRKEGRIFRTYLDTGKTNDEGFFLQDKFKVAGITIETISHYAAHQLKASAGKENYQCIISTPQYQLQFPLKHYNIFEGKYQVETGPVALPIKEQLCTAYVVFNSDRGFEALIYEDKNGQRMQAQYEEHNCEIKIISAL
jgi:hypothetical protein